MCCPWLGMEEVLISCDSLEWINLRARDLAQWRESLPGKVRGHEFNPRTDRFYCSKCSNKSKSIVHDGYAASMS